MRTTLSPHPPQTAGLPFVLGHAPYMHAIHIGNTENARLAEGLEHLAYFLRISSHAAGRGTLTPVRGWGLRASAVNHQARSAPHPSPGGVGSCT